MTQTAVNRPEAELLLLCARSSRDPERTALIQALLRDEIDWTYLLQMALRHRVTPLLYWNLNAICPGDIPDIALNQLRNHFIANSRRNLLLTGELFSILNAFGEQGITVVPYKGPVLAAVAYGNLALREFGDLDILVRKRDISEAKDAMLSLGYRQQDQLTEVQEAVLLRSHSEYIFEKENGSLVELHWAIMPRKQLFALEKEGLWKRLGRSPLGGGEVPVFSPEDTLLILCAHGSKHRWERLAWICDVAELIRSHQDIRWEWVLAQARTLGGEHMLLLGLFLANDLLGADLPEEILRRVRGNRTVRNLAERIAEQLFREADGARGFFEGASFRPVYLRMRERLSDKIRYCVHAATSQTVEDWGMVSLPKSLFPLYYALRLIRLTKKYGRKMLERTRAV